jgi:hypothetical protein
MRIDEFLMLLMKANRCLGYAPRATFPLLLSLVLSFTLVCSFGCAPSSTQTESSPTDASESSNLPEITDDVIRERINYTRVRGIPVENENAEPISWMFVGNEPKEITVIEKKIEGNRATIVLDIKTSSGPNARNPRVLAGQIRTEWALKSGWALRQWEIVDTENISMKVRNLPKPTEQNSNR